MSLPRLVTATPTMTQRAATAETVNADAKRHRGLDKVLGCVSLFVLTYDILRLLALGA